MYRNLDVEKHRVWRQLCEQEMARIDAEQLVKAAKEDDGSETLCHRYALRQVIMGLK